MQTFKFIFYIHLLHFFFILATIYNLSAKVAAFIRGYMYIVDVGN